MKLESLNECPMDSVREGRMKLYEAISGLNACYGGPLGFIYNA